MTDMLILLSSYRKQLRCKQQQLLTVKGWFLNLLLSSRGHTLVKHSVFTICLSWQSTPLIGGPTHCYELRGCLINICWPPSSPRCENKVCFPWSWRKYSHLTIAYDLRKAGTIQLVARFWKVAGQEVLEGSGKRPSKKFRHRCTHGMK